MGVTPKDMDFAAGKDDAARDICTAFGVPHVLIVPGQSTYNNIREAKLELWEDTILPLVDKAVDASTPGWSRNSTLACRSASTSTRSPPWSRAARASASRSSSSMRRA
jgi:phage portal protein BeeE